MAAALIPAVDGVVAGRLVEPDTPEALAAALGATAQARQTLLLQGAGTKAAWARPVEQVDVLVRTTRLTRLLAHEQGDLTVTVEAGVALAELNARLREAGQWLPLDPPHGAAATVGGLLATNDSGPLRHRFGTPRDLVLGVELATASGVLARAGGRVVKNVAGYDLSRLVAGSFGSLAAIVSATFKLAPLPRDSRTVRCAAATDTALAERVQALMQSHVDVAASDVSVTFGETAGGDERALLVRALTVHGDAGIEARLVQQQIGTADTRVVDGAEEAALWARQQAGPDGIDLARVRLGWRPARLAEALGAMRAALGGVPASLTGRAAVGAGVLAFGGDADQQAAIVTRLRGADALGHVVIRAGSAALRRRVDPFGPLGSADAVLHRLKASLDPTTMLNPGRGPL